MKRVPSEQIGKKNSLNARAPSIYADLNDPQSLNLYGYVLNNPMISQDIDGHGGCDGVRDLCRAIRDAVSEGRSIAEGWQDRFTQIQDQLANGVESAKKDLIGSMNIWVSEKQIVRVEEIAVRL